MYINLLLNLLIKSSRSHLSCDYEFDVSLLIIQIMRCYVVIYATTSLIARLCCNAIVVVAVFRTNKISLRSKQKSRYEIFRIQNIERVHFVKVLHLVNIRSKRHEVVLRRHTSFESFASSKSISESSASSRQSRKLCIEQIVSHSSRYDVVNIQSTTTKFCVEQIVHSTLFDFSTSAICEFKKTTKQNVHTLKTSKQTSKRATLQRESEQQDKRDSRHTEHQETTQSIQRERDSKRINVLASNSLISASIEDIRTRKLV